MTCPKCGSKKMHRSRGRGIYERMALRAFRRYPFHCDECGVRFYARRPKFVRASSRGSATFKILDIGNVVEPSQNCAIRGDVRPRKEAPLRILIADDHAVVRKGVASILSSATYFEVCAEAENGEDAVQKTLQFNPDVVILDITMPVLDGLAAARKIRAFRPKTSILMLSLHHDAEIVAAAQSAGAQGFVTKTEIAGALLQAVDAVLRGQTFFSRVSAETRWRAL
jgi:CheY-like chemotaxis protein